MCISPLESFAEATALGLVPIERSTVDFDLVAADKLLVDIRTGYVHRSWSIAVTTRRAGPCDWVNLCA